MPAATLDPRGTRLARLRLLAPPLAPAPTPRASTVAFRLVAHRLPSRLRMPRLARGMASSPPEWRSLPVVPQELSLSRVLRNGQSFRWRHHPKSDEWSCALGGRILTLRQDGDNLLYRAVFPEQRAATPPVPASAVDAAVAENMAEAAEAPEAADDDTPALLYSYFNLSYSLAGLYARWSAADPHFARVTASAFAGIRVLRQDPFENLISFICSSNNNIARISTMVHSLCTHFGPHLGTLDGVDYHDFPTPAALAAPDVEKKLRGLAFGYRAGYISKTAARIAGMDDGLGWLEELRQRPYADAKEALLQLSGVGPKVADCVCLMSLDKPEAVPVDTHVWQIARRDYGLHTKMSKAKKGLGMTQVAYDQTGDFFRKLWGDEAGWAHSVLFTADLKVFASERAPKNKRETEETPALGDDSDSSELSDPPPSPPRKRKAATAAGTEAPGSERKKKPRNKMRWLV